MPPRAAVARGVHACRDAPRRARACRVPFRRSAYEHAVSRWNSGPRTEPARHRIGARASRFDTECHSVSPAQACLSLQRDEPIEHGYMPAKAKTAARKRPSASAQKSSRAVRLFVRRGAEQRFEKLKEKTAELDVVVSWDRRESDRRATVKPVKGERRKRDRRQEPSFTWEMADFAVVVDSAPGKE